MAHRSNMSPGPRNPPVSSSEPVRFSGEPVPRGPGSRGPESDIASLFAKFEQNSGGTLSPQFAADLALDIVLNEIVEQACLVTGATGAAIVMRRATEFVCRASTGPSAPNLGAKMDAYGGLSGRCIQTGEMQKCENSQTDLRADQEASLRLGVRSVMVLPLTQARGVLGLLEVMSDRVSAFGGTEQRTLEVLAARALRNIERAADPFLLRADVESTAVPKESESTEERRLPPLIFNEPLSGPIFASTPEDTGVPTSRIDVPTLIMGLTLLGAVVLIGVLTARRFGWNLPRFRVEAAKVSGQLASKSAVSAGTSGVGERPMVTETSASTLVSVGKNISPRAAPDQAPSGDSHWEGGLRVYDNGREIFRLPPPRAAVETEEQEASLAKREPLVIERSPAWAQSRLTQRVEPAYPESARAQNLQGQVVLRIIVRPDGTVQDAQPISGEPLLARAAQDAVKQWRFKTQRGSDDMSAWRTQVTLNFRLPH